VVVAVAALEVDVHCARLVFLRSVGGEAGGPARYALSLHVVDSLIDRRVGLLLVGGAVRLAPGLQYFQQRLGFEIFNVRPVLVGRNRVPRQSRAPRRSAVTAPGRALLLLALMLVAAVFFHTQDQATWEEFLDTLMPIEISLTGVAYLFGQGL
jgi:hypothetical protein